MRSGVGLPFDKVSVGCFAVLLLFNMSRMKNRSMWDSGVDVGALLNC